MLKPDIDYQFKDEVLYINSNDEWVPIALEGYEFCSVIAPGANGVTVKAYHPITDRYVAVKVWKPRHDDLAMCRAQYMNEIRKISKIRHQNIVTVHDGRVLDSGFCVAVMDYIDGTPFREWQKINHSDDVRINVCRSILTVVLEYQRLGVLHGDLHSGNILIEKDDTIHIIDFGTSFMADTNKSSERECYFVAKLVKSLLGKLKGYDKNHFAFAPHKKELCLVMKNDRFFDGAMVPLLLTETMIHYTGIVEMLTHLKSLDYTSMVELSGLISKTRYLDIDYLAIAVVSNYVEEGKEAMFLKILVENIQVDVFAEYTDDLDGNEILFQASGYVYYDMVKAMGTELSSPYGVDILVSDEEQRTHKTEMTNRLIAALPNYLRDKESDYFQTCDKLSTELEEGFYSIQDEIRAILYYSLKHSIGNYYLLTYTINTRINEALLDSDLRGKMDDAIEKINNFYV